MMLEFRYESGPNYEHWRMYIYCMYTDTFILSTNQITFSVSVESFRIFAVSHKVVYFIHTHTHIKVFKVTVLEPHSVSSANV